MRHEITDIQLKYFAGKKFSHNKFAENIHELTRVTSTQNEGTSPSHTYSHYVPYSIGTIDLLKGRLLGQSTLLSG